MNFIRSFGASGVRSSSTISPSYRPLLQLQPSQRPKKLPLHPNLPPQQKLLQVKTLPNINHRGWLAVWAQKRRRKRLHLLLPAPVLRPEYPDKLAWD